MFWTLRQSHRGCPRDLFLILHFLDPHQPIKLSSLKYDDYAIARYLESRKLRDEGIISKGVRFQVLLSSPVNVVGTIFELYWRTTMKPFMKQSYRLL